MRNKREYEEMKWKENFELAKEFKEKYGRFPKSTEEYKGVKLGGWLNNQKNRLTNRSVRMEMLKSIGFRFERVSDIQWEKNLNLFKEYIDKYGKYPGTKESYKGVNLGNWIESIRYSYAMNKSNENAKFIMKLTEDRIKQLEEINFEFTDWEINFKLLKEFKEEYGRFPKYGEIYKDFNIGFYVCNLRNRYNKDDRYIRKELVEALEEIGFNLSNKQYNTWYNNFKILKEFKEEYGRLPLNREVYKGVKIGIWLMNHKKYDRDNPERKQLLQSIGVKFKEVK